MNKDIQRTLTEVLDKQDFNIQNFFTRSQEFSKALKERWLDKICVKHSSYITLNISQPIVEKYNLFSLGENLSPIAVCRLFSKIKGLSNTKIFWYIPGINYEEGITFNKNILKWKTNKTVNCYSEKFSLTKLYHLLNDFYYVNNICKQYESALWWYSDDKNILSLLNTKILHELYLNKNTLYAGRKLIQLSNYFQLEKEDFLIKKWLEKCRD